jgi:hypothetical protein
MNCSVLINGGGDYDISISPNIDITYTLMVRRLSFTTDKHRWVDISFTTLLF